MLEHLYSREDVVRDTIIDTRRWSTDHELIFRHEGKLYSTLYSHGSTECQEESPWEYKEEVECYEVEPYQKLVTEYKEV